MRYVAKAVLYNPDGHILILRRSKTHPVLAYEVDFPGGIIERGETVIDGLLREVYEETGIQLDATSLTQVHDQADVGNEHHHVFVAQLAATPDVTISWEHDQYQWANPQKTLDSLLAHPSPDTSWPVVITYLQSVQQQHVAPTA